MGFPPALSFEMEGYRSKGCPFFPKKIPVYPIEDRPGVDINAVINFGADESTSPSWKGDRLGGGGGSYLGDDFLRGGG